MVRIVRIAQIVRFVRFVRIVQKLAQIVRIVQKLAQIVRNFRAIRTTPVKGLIFKVIFLTSLKAFRVRKKASCTEFCRECDGSVTTSGFSVFRLVSAFHACRVGDRGSFVWCRVDWWSVYCLWLYVFEEVGVTNYPLTVN